MVAPCHRYAPRSASSPRSTFSGVIGSVVTPEKVLRGLDALRGEPA